MPSDFHGARKPPAILKHGILISYLGPWAAKVGSASPGGRVVVVDGFAGRPLYLDEETPESPTLITNFAEGQAMKATPRDVDRLFIELNADNHRALVEEFGERALQGRFEDNVDQVLGRSVGVPLFVYIDPTGSLPAMETVVSLLTSPKPRNVELLLHFSRDALRAAFVNSPRFEAAMGGGWCKPIAAAKREGWELEILNGYRRRLMARVGGRYTADAVPVPNGWRGSARYWLIHVTASPHGRVAFVTALPRAFDDYWKAVGPELFSLSLFADPSTGLIADQTRGEVQEAIARRLPDLWARSPRIPLGDRIYDVVGGELGFARMKDITMACQQAVGRIEGAAYARRVLIAPGG